MRANEAFWRAHPELVRRLLTDGPGDADLRAQWRRLYRDEAAKSAPTPPAPRLLPVADVPLPAATRVTVVTPCVVEAMTHEEKMALAIERSEVWPALRDQVDLKAMVATMVVTFAGLAVIAATGAGAVVEGVGAGLLIVGGLLSGYQIGGGLMDLYDFFDMTRCDTARSQADLEAAGKKFVSGVAKTGVGTLFLMLGLKGAGGKTWNGKSPISKSPPATVLSEAELAVTEDKYATWVKAKGDSRAVVRIESTPEGPKVTDLYKGDLASGSGSDMLAAGLEKSGLESGGKFSISGIVNPETMAAYESGVPAEDSLLGKVGTNALEKMGLKPSSISYEIVRDKLTIIFGVE